MKSLTVLESKQIIELMKKLEQEIKNTNRKNWLQKLGNKMQDLGFIVSYGSSVTSGKTSGSISIIHKSKVRIYSWGSSRCKYSLHNWLEVSKKSSEV